MKKIILAAVAAVTLWSGAAWCAWPHVSELSFAPVVVLAR